MNWAGDDAKLQLAELESMFPQVVTTRPPTPPALPRATGSERARITAHGA